MNFTCDICEKLFPVPIELKWHINVDHCENVAYICDICEKLYKTKLILRNHYNHNHNATAAREYKCISCTKSFKHEWTLSFHIKTVHEGHKVLYLFHIHYKKS